MLLAVAKVVPRWVLIHDMTWTFWVLAFRKQEARLGRTASWLDVV
jgi:hypothetical protein